MSPQQDLKEEDATTVTTEIVPVLMFIEELWFTSDSICTSILHGSIMRSVINGHVIDSSVALAILVRKDDVISYFRHYLKALVQLPNSDGLLLCSGYISETNAYSILDDELWTWISVRYAKDPLKIVTVGGMYFGGINDPWLLNYERFVSRLKKKLIKHRNQGISLEALIAPKGNWHAKIAIKTRGDTPVAGIIGSSNLTRPAFAEKHNLRNSRFNHEGDVVIWCEGENLDGYFLSPPDTPNLDYGNTFSPIQAVLKPHFDQRSERDRLKSIYDEVLHSKEGRKLERLDSWLEKNKDKRKVKDRG